MVLCQELQVNGKEYPMTGIFPARAEFCPRPQGLGYVEATVEAENPFHPVGALLRGHEFHYSRCVALGELEPTLRLSPGVGMSGPGHRAKGLRRKARTTSRAATGSSSATPSRRTRTSLRQPSRTGPPASPPPAGKRPDPQRGWRFLKESHATLSPPPPTRFILSATLRFDLRFDAPTPADKTPAIVAPPQKKKESMICSVIFS